MRKLLALAVIIASLACGGDSTAPAASVVGTWDLQTIDGADLPFVYQTIGTTVYAIMNETAVFAPAGGISISTTIRTTPPGTNSVSLSSEAWEQAGSTVTCSGDNDPATISGDLLTRHTYSGYVYTYLRR